MQRAFLLFGGFLGALAVGLGAYGAHGLEALLEGAPDGARRLAWWHTAVSYQLPHAVMLVLVAQLAERRSGRALAIAGGAFLFGVVVFSGTLYAMSLGAAARAHRPRIDASPRAA